MKVPHSTEAERSVLGQIMARGPQTAGEIIGTLLEGQHFYDAAHRLIFDKLVECYYGDEPMDGLSIGERLAPKLAGVWGVSEDDAIIRCRDLAVGQRHTGDITDHAAIVKREFDRRELLEVAASIQRAVEDGEKSPEEIGGMASTDAMRIATDSLLTRDLVSFGDFGRDFIVRAQKERQMRQQGVELGAYFGLRFIDDWTLGLRPSELLFCAGEPGAGKALAVDTPLPTPNGWTTMGRVAVGDHLLDEEGEPCRVVAATEVMDDRECFRLTFSDGASVIADADHSWVVSTRKAYMRAYRQGGDDSSEATLATTTTRELYDAQERGERPASVAVARPLDLPRQNLPIRPYVLGCWLGDGHSTSGRLTCADPQIVAEIEGEGQAIAPRSDITYVMPGLQSQLHDLGLIGEKRIPAAYLRASLDQRIDLMQGIVDTDGHVSKRGQIEVTLMNEGLARDVRELALTLGAKVTLTVDRARLNGRLLGDRYRVRFLSGYPLARLDRKRDRLRLGLVRGRHTRRTISRIEPCPSVPVRCVEVSSPSHLYLAGEEMIPTHNSALWWTAALRFAERQMSRQPQYRIGTLILSLEMGKEPSQGRLAQTLTSLDGRKFRESTFSDRDLQEVKSEWGRRKDLPLYFNHASSLRASQIRALCVEAIRRYNVGLVVIDHFRYFDMDRHYQNKNDEDDAKVRFLKEGLAKDLNLAVICIAHTVKAIETADGRPTKKHLRGSGQISADADLVSFVYRPYNYASEKAKERGDVRETDAELIWDKNRNSTDGAAEFYFEPSTMTIRDTYPGRT